MTRNGTTMMGQSGGPMTVHTRFNSISQFHQQCGTFAKKFFEHLVRIRIKKEEEER